MSHMIANTLKQAAIYHFSAGMNLHPGVTNNKIHTLRNYALNCGYDVTQIYRDYSRLRIEQDNLQLFLAECSKYDALFVQDLNHLSRTTTKSMSIVTKLVNMGLRVYTLNNGSFGATDDLLQTPLNVATYYNCSITKGNPEPVININNEIFQLFASKKTNWKIIDQYADASERQSAGEQPNLINLINNKQKYNLLLVHNLNDVHERTSTFLHIREKLATDIYSIADGLLPYRKDFL